MSVLADRRQDVELADVEQQVSPLELFFDLVFVFAITQVTGFIAHAGSPPLQVFLLPLRLPPAILVGTVAVLFAGLNYAKVVPYWWLGLLSVQNVSTAAALVPVGVAGVYIGLWLQRRVNARLFYTLIYAFLLLTGLRLFYDGLRGIL